LHSNSTFFFIATACHLTLADSQQSLALQQTIICNNSQTATPFIATANHPQIDDPQHLVLELNIIYVATTHHPTKWTLAFLPLTNHLNQHQCIN